MKGKGNSEGRFRSRNQLGVVPASPRRSVWISRRGKDEGGLVQNDIFVLSDLDLMEKRQENGIVIGSS